MRKGTTPLIAGALVILAAGVLGEVTEQDGLLEAVSAAGIIAALIVLAVSIPHALIGSDD